MKFYSTKNKNKLVGFKNAVLNGLAEDGGLYMPSEIPPLKNEFFTNLSDYTLQEIAFIISQKFIDNLSKGELKNIVEKTFTFDAPLVHLDEHVSILELFHGPTLAFKDFGARFLANTVAAYIKDQSKEVIVLVATSGDTGSAVAHGFHKMEGIKVCLLYPRGKVSWIQERQLTTLGDNISSFEIDGTFDDCQDLVKQAFLDNDLRQKFYLTSANSINIARLLPQSFYYLYAFGQLQNEIKKLVISVPSGNFGNLTAGLFAHKMGLKIDHFMVALNANDIIHKYLETGVFQPRPAVKTLSNAMDVGNPSNFKRILTLYNNRLDLIRNILHSESITDEETVAGINEVYQRYGYILDPHGAVGYQALRKQKTFPENDCSYIVLETAHPAKFSTSVESVLNVKIEIPDRLADNMKKQKRSIPLSKKFQEFKSYIISSY
jgi:threonine synthase